MTLRLAFMGSPDFAVPALAELIAAGHEVACVYTQPPKPAGRGKTLRKTAVHQFAEANGFEVRTPRSLKKTDAQEAFAALNLDLAVVVAYGLILPQAILDAPTYGCVNLHGSLLPRWRGAAPIQRAIMAGDERTGVQAMLMEAGLDTGPVLLSEAVAILPTDTAGTLHDKLAKYGADLLPRALAGLVRGSLTPQPQTDAGVTYASKLTADDQKIDWTRAGSVVDCQIRGLSPFPGAYFTFPTAKGERRVKALFSKVEPGADGDPGQALDDRLLIACGAGAVRLLNVQMEGKGVLDAQDFLLGHPAPAGTLFR